MMEGQATLAHEGQAGGTLRAGPRRLGSSNSTGSDADTFLIWDLPGVGSQKSPLGGKVTAYYYLALCVLVLVLCVLWLWCINWCRKPRWEVEDAPEVTENGLRATAEEGVELSASADRYERAAYALFTEERAHVHTLSSIDNSVRYDEPIDAEEESAPLQIRRDTLLFEWSKVRHAHEALLAELESDFAKYGLRGTRYGQILSAFAPNLPLLLSYAQHYRGPALAHLQELRLELPQVYAALNTKVRTHVPGMETIDDCAMLPLKRIQRYAALLESMASSASDDIGDALQEALILMRRIVDEVPELIPA